MSRFEWWRSHHGAPTDPKWPVIAKRAGVAPGVVAAIAWALLDHASQSDDRGLVADFDPETYAAYSGFEEAQIIAGIEAMGAKGVIVEGRIAKWEKRQPKREDDSTERTRRYRERWFALRQGPFGMKTLLGQIDAPVTETIRQLPDLISKVDRISAHVETITDSAKTSVPTVLDDVQTVTGNFDLTDDVAAQL